MTEAAPDRAAKLGSGRRARRASRVVFSVPRGLLQLALAALVASWALAYGLGRRAGSPTASAPALALDPPAPALEPPDRPREPAPRPQKATPSVVSATRAVARALEPVAASRVERRLELREDVPSDGFGIQIGAYPDRAEAEAAASRLAEELLGLDVFLIPVDIPGKGTWYRVRVGRFATRQDAESKRKSLSVASGALSLPYR